LDISDKLLLRGNFIPDMSYKDNEGNNLLHSLAKASCKSEYAKKALIILTRDGKNKKALNCRNKYGKQPLHYLSNNSNTDIMNFLINNGAELISAIETDNNHDINSIPISIYSTQTEYPKLQIRRPEPEHNDTSNIFVKQVSNPIDLLNDIMNVFPHTNNTQLADTVATNNTEQDNELRNMSEKILSMLDSKNLDPNTDNFVKLLEQSMTGGGKKQSKNTANRVVGNRNMKTYSELTEAIDMFGGNSEADELTTELARVVENKAGKYHEIALDKILTFLKDKNDMLLAKVVKAIIYGEIKTTKPELSNLDRAMETLNAITEKKVKQILKQKDKIEEIKQHIINKSKAKATAKALAKEKLTKSSEFESSVSSHSTDSMKSN
jgi:flagellar biosynthesis chaperone FliJ